MILFLNFAPIEFMGGAEQWILGMANETNKHEQTVVIDVAKEISSIYANLVLKRGFNINTSLADELKNIKKITLRVAYFIPFTPQYFEVRRLFYDARLIYIKYELLELFISLYFGGFGVLKKIIGGIHSPLIYNNPQGFLPRFHNFLYSSSFYGFFTRRVRNVHVLNTRDYAFLRKKFAITNIVHLFDGIEIKPENDSFEETHSKNLRIIVVGELSLRKGTDTLCSIIESSPKNFIFTIVGDGPLKSKVMQISNERACHYMGYVNDKKKLRNLYRQNDVLLFPSRAETQGLVIAEAMSCGLRVVNSIEVALGMPDWIELTNQSSSVAEYIRLLRRVLDDKKKIKIPRKNIHKYAYDNFSNDKIYPRFLEQILNIKT